MAIAPNRKWNNSFLLRLRQLESRTAPPIPWVVVPMVVHRLITHRVFFVVGVLVLGMLAAACGGGSVAKNQPISSLSPTPTPNASPTATPPANPSPTPSSSQVVIVLEENHSFAD